MYSRSTMNQSYAPPTYRFLQVASCFRHVAFYKLLSETSCFLHVAFYKFPSKNRLLQIFCNSNKSIVSGNKSNVKSNKSTVAIYKSTVALYKSTVAFYKFFVAFHKLPSTNRRWIRGLRKRRRGNDAKQYHYLKTVF